MKLIRLLTASAALIALSLLGACGHGPNDLRAARSLSCTQLARELGRLEQRSDAAGIDSTFATLEGAFANRDTDETAAEISGLVHDVDQIDADKSIDQLTQIYTAKGCI